MQIHYAAFIDITNLSSQVCCDAISSVTYNVYWVSTSENVKTKSNLYNLNNDGTMGDIHAYTYDIYFPHVTAALFI